MTSLCKIIRVNPDSYRLDAEAPHPRTIAFVNQIYDRTNRPTGWRLKPEITIQGSKSRVWPSPEHAIASTQLMTAAKARAAIAALQSPARPEKGAAP